MKSWYISYTYVDGFGNRQYKSITKKLKHPLEWVGPIGYVVIFWSEIPESLM